MKKGFLFLLFTFLYFQNIGLAQVNIQSAINEFVNHPSLEAATLSICVTDAETGAIVGSYNANKVAVPASTTKLFTTATSLGLLGQDHTFKTQLLYDGNISNGVLHGNLIIKGYGDPTSGDTKLADATATYLQNITNKLKEKNIREITGHIIGDGSYYSSQLSNGHLIWADIGNYYGIGVGGLNIHQNQYQLTLQQNPSLGGKVKFVKTTPKVINGTFVSEVTSGSKYSGDQAYIYGSPYSSNRVIRGTIPLGSKHFNIKGSLPDPSLQFSFELKSALQAQGINVKGKAHSEKTISTLEKNRTLLFEITSPTLNHIVDEVNQKSNNYYAYSLVKAIGKQQCGIGSYSKGTETIETYWKDKGINVKGMKIYDGAGLSPKNKISAFQFCQLLQHMRNNKTFENSLAIAGKTGTMRYLLKSTATNGTVKGKSGTIEDVRCYSGYSYNNSGKKLTFAFLVNNFEGKSSAIRKQLEALMAKITYY